MTTEPVTISIYFDFLCPYTHRVCQWLDRVQQEMGESLIINWKYFSLEQNNAPESLTTKIWEQPDDYEPMIPGRGKKTRALLAFWGAEAARQQGSAAFDRFRQALYNARHCERLDFSQRANVEQVAAQAELDMDRFRQDFNDRRMLEALRRDHEEAVSNYQIFGVPTLVFDDTNAIYLKLMQQPPAEDAVQFLLELRQTMTLRPWLAELKRPNPGQPGQP